MCWNSLLNALNSLGFSLSVKSNNLLIWNYVCKKYLNEVKKTDPINGNNKNLHSSEYAKKPNEISWNCFKGSKKINVWLSNAIQKITGNYMDSLEEASVEQFDHLPKLGEHVAVF